MLNIPLDQPSPTKPGLYIKWYPEQESPVLHQVSRKEILDDELRRIWQKARWSARLRLDKPTPV